MKFGVFVLGLLGCPFRSFSEDPRILPLYLFYGGTVVMITFYGGIFSVLPAYLADVFG
jgi:hypothetical protein